MNPIRSELIHNICEFLSVVEDQAPIPGHPNLLDDWELDIREYFEQVFQPSEDEQKIFDLVLSARRDMYMLAVGKNAQMEQSQSDHHSWQWLLDATQVEQRTQEWYREKENLLTASEIADIWAGPLTRARLVKSKVPKPLEEEQIFSQRLAVPRAEGHAMDWGVRYEPVVKMILEKNLDIRIRDLGRIRHQTIPRLAASPDGLITESKGQEDLLGKLVEIKCPPSREIKDEIPFSYWCQMQIQMEVCDRPACEYVEVKFKEVEADDPDAEGWITLEQKMDSNDMRYQYHQNPLTPPSENDWISIETYGWNIVQLRRITVQRDPHWFEAKQGDLEAFWKDVEDARAGTWIPPPPRVKKQKEVKEIAFLPDDPLTV